MQPPQSMRSSSLVILLHPPSQSRLKITNCSFSMQHISYGRNFPILFQWRSQDLVLCGAQPLSPFFHSFPSPLPSVLSPPSHLPFILPAVAFPLPCSPINAAGGLSSPGGSGQSPAAKQFLVHFPFCIQSLLIGSLWVVVVLTTVEFFTYLVIAMDRFYSL